MTMPKHEPDLEGMSVVFVLYYYIPYTSGLTRYTQSLAEELARRGANVTVVAGQHAADLPRRACVNGVDIIRLRLLARVDKGIVLPGLVPRIRALARQADVVIPVLPLLEAGILARVVPRRKLLPIYVCDLRLGSGMVGRVVERLAAASARAAVARTSTHIALSDDYARASRVIARYSSRTVGIEPPVDAKEFNPVDANDLRKRLAIGDSLVVGFVGRLVMEKGVDHLIRAMRRVRSRFPTTLLVIAGEGRGVAGGGVLDDLQALSAEDAGVMFTGFLESTDLRAFYSMCAVVALPSIDPLEAFGMVQVEAMLCGTPVVASDLPGVRLPVLRTGMGRLVPPADEAALADALVEVLGNRARFVRVPEEVRRLMDPAPTFDRLSEVVSQFRTEGRSDAGTSRAPSAECNR